MYFLNNQLCINNTGTAKHPPIEYSIMHKHKHPTEQMTWIKHYINFSPDRLAKMTEGQIEKGDVSLPTAPLAFVLSTRRINN